MGLFRQGIAAPSVAAEIPNTVFLILRAFKIIKTKSRYGAQVSLGF